MVIIDGSFLLGLAAVLTSLGTLWRALRGHPAPQCPNLRDCQRTSCETCLNCRTANDERD